MNLRNQACDLDHGSTENRPMRMTIVDYSWQHRPRRARIIGLTGTRIVLALPIVAIVASFIAALVVAGGTW